MKLLAYFNIRANIRATAFYLRCFLWRLPSTRARALECTQRKTREVNKHLHNFSAEYTYIYIIFSG